MLRLLVPSSVGSNYPPAPEERALSPPTEDEDQPPPIPGRHLPDLIQNNHSLSNGEEVREYRLILSYFSQSNVHLGMTIFHGHANMSQKKTSSSIQFLRVLHEQKKTVCCVLKVFGLSCML